MNLIDLADLKNRLNSGIIRLFDTDYHVGYIEYKADSFEVYVFLVDDIYSHLVPVSLSPHDSEWDNHNKVLETTYDKVTSLTGQTWRRKAENELNIHQLEAMGIAVYDNQGNLRSMVDIINNISQIIKDNPTSDSKRLVDITAQIMNGGQEHEDN